MVIGHLLTLMGTCESVVRGSGEARVLTLLRYCAQLSVESSRGWKTIGLIKKLIHWGQSGPGRADWKKAQFCEIAA